CRPSSRARWNYKRPDYPKSAGRMSGLWTFATETAVKTGASMATTLNGRRKVRKSFGSSREVTEMPNLIEVQKASYDQFLLVDEPKGGRCEEGLQAVFKSVFPITDFSNTASLEFVRYEFEQPKYDVDECRQRDMTFAAP